MSMIPGMGKAMKGMDIDDDAFKGVEAIIKSMTPHERSNPKIINEPQKTNCQRLRNNFARGEPTH